MIKLDLSNINISKENLLDNGKKIKDIFLENFVNKNGYGSEMMDWVDYQDKVSKEELNDLKSTIDNLKNKLNVEYLLVIGIGGSFLGAKSAIDFVKGSFEQTKKVIFVGTNFSTSNYKQVSNFLDENNKTWAMVVISKSGKTLETVVAFDYFLNNLKNKYKENFNKYIFAVTEENSYLDNLAKENSFKSFSMPKGIGGRFSVMTNVGLFPMIFAGLNVEDIFEGAKKAKKDFFNDDLENNSAFLYSLIRYLEYKDGISNELFINYDYDLTWFGKWYQQLFAESEGKDKKGLFPVPLTFSADLHSVGQLIQDGKKTFFETTLLVSKDNNFGDVKINSLNLDILNNLNTDSLNEINNNVSKGTIKAHFEEANVDNVIIKIEDKSELSLGYLIYWFFLSVTMSAYLLDVNPFDQPGVEVYKKNVNKILAK